MDQVWKTVLAIIASVGGAGVIVSAIVAFCANIIAKRLEQRYSQKLDMELEKYKSILNKKEFVSKVRFEKEFEIYIELTEKITKAVYAAGLSVKIVHGLFYSLEDIPEISVFIEDFTAKLNDADQTNKRYAPFIKCGIFCLNKEIDEQCTDIYRLFLIWNRLKSDNLKEIKTGDKSFTAEIVQKSIVTKQKELSKMYDGLITTVRQYMDSLEITETK